VSIENVQIVRRLLEAFNDRDLDAMLAGVHPEAELQSLRAQLEGKAYRGHEGVRQMLADFAEDWAFVRMDAKDFREADDQTASGLDDQVVMLGRLRARGRASGVDLDVPIGVVWTLRDGKVVRAKTFSEQADALRAAGFE
jgi:ketosteroid isomerase-like protein